jgi:P-aminobenzoate N-oxygenase AurF
MRQTQPSYQHHAAKPDFTRVVERLCDLSVRKAHDPFLDIVWDAPDAQIDVRDPRFRLHPDQPLGATAWYAALSPDDQSRLGLDLLCQSFEFGIALENTLSRGLLTYIHARGDRTAVYRYALHEVIEECKHSLMFRTFVERSGRPTVRLGAFDMWTSWRVAQLAPLFPELFFVWVLAGEVFVDDDNRQQLTHRSELHPIVARVLQIHVTEEARHKHFAEHYVLEHLPRLGPCRRALIRAFAPTILYENARVILQPSASIVKRYGIPRDVLREAFGSRSKHHARVQSVAESVLALLREPSTKRLLAAH